MGFCHKFVAFLNPRIYLQNLQGYFSQTKYLYWVSQVVLLCLVLRAGQASPAACPCPQGQHLAGTGRDLSPEAPPLSQHSRHSLGHGCLHKMLWNQSQAQQWAWQVQWQSKPPEILVPTIAAHTWITWDLCSTHRPAMSQEHLKGRGLNFHSAPCTRNLLQKWHMLLPAILKG